MKKHHAFHPTTKVRFFLLGLLLLSSLLVGIVMCSYPDVGSVRLLSTRSDLGPVTGVSFINGGDDFAWTTQGISDSADQNFGGGYGLKSSSVGHLEQVFTNSEGLNGVRSFGKRTAFIGRRGKLYFLNEDGSLSAMFDRKVWLSAIHFGEDGALYLGDAEGFVIRLNADDLTVTKEWRPHHSHVTQIKSHKGKLLSTSLDRTLVVTDIATETSETLKFDYIIEWMDVSPSSGHVLIGTPGGTFFVDIESLTSKSKLVNLPASTTGAWLGDEGRFILFLNEGTAAIGSAEDPSPKPISLPTRINLKTYPVVAVDYMPKSGLLLVGHQGGMVQLIKLKR